METIFIQFYIYLIIIQCQLSLSAPNYNKSLILTTPTPNISIIESHTKASVPKSPLLVSQFSNSTLAQDDQMGKTKMKVEKNDDNFFTDHSYDFMTNGFKNLQSVDICRKQSQCQNLETSTCFGVKLPYKQTSLALTGLASQSLARETLKLWNVLRNVPRCWAVIQPFLCAIFLPQCDNSSVQLPSKEMCQRTRGPCKIVELERGWPSYLQCKEEFSPYCKTASHDLLFNTTGECALPLVATSREEIWYEGFKGCGIQCENPLLTTSEHKEINSLISVSGFLCLGLSLFTVLTYLIDRRNSFKYPSIIIFGISVCYLIASSSLMIQLQESFRQNHVCHSEGTFRKTQVTTSCSVLMHVVYHCIFAAGMWFMIWSYALHKSFKSKAPLSCQQEPNKSYYKYLPFGIQVVAFIVILINSKPEIDSVYGICFLPSDIYWRTFGLLVPLMIFLGIGCCFLFSSLVTLTRMKMQCSAVIKEHANKKITITIIRLMITCSSLLICFVISIYCHFYIYRNQDSWLESLRKYILCSSMITHGQHYDPWSSKCSLDNRPNIIVYKLHLVSYFASGIVISSWCWTASTLNAWQRFIRRVMDVEQNEPIHLKKHQIIADAFAKRKDFNRPSRLSISLRSFHSDPLGVNFVTNSATSGGLSSSWAAAMPRLMCRREALFGSAIFLPRRRNSIDSIYSIRSRVSFESTSNDLHWMKRHSLDSQMSFRVSEVERRLSRCAMDKRLKGGRRKRKHSLSLSMKRRSSFLKRRNSVTSDDSNFGSYGLPSFPHNTRRDSLFTRMMKIVHVSNDTTSTQHKGKENGGLAPYIGHNPEDDDSAPEEVLAVEPQQGPFKRNTTSGSFHRHGKTREPYRKKNHVIKASVGVQTSLESIDISPPPMEDKGCQVSSPLLLKAHPEQKARLSTSDSTSSHNTTCNINVDGGGVAEYAVSKRSKKASSENLKKSSLEAPLNGFCRSKDKSYHDTSNTDQNHELLIESSS